MSLIPQPLSGGMPLSRWVSLGYASPVIIHMFIISALAVVQGIYATYFGLPLTTIAAIILLARVFDAVSDPLIGLWADQYYLRSGSYKPFVICGALLLLVSSYFLYVPVSEQSLQAAEASGVSVKVGAGYFLGWYIALYLGATLFDVPHFAWGRVLAPDPQGRLRLYSWRTMAVLAGSLLFYAVPLMPIIGSGEFTPASLRWVVILSSVLLVFLLTLSLRLTPNSSRPLVSSAGAADNPVLPRKARHNIGNYVRELLGNKPFGLFMLAVFCSIVPISGMWFTLLFIYVDSYLQLGGQFAFASTLAIVVGLVMVPLWAALAQRLGKREVIVTGLLIGAAGIAATGLLNPGEDGAVLLILVMVLCHGIGFSALGMLCPPLLADIIDYSCWKSGTDRGASYFSLYIMAGKVGMAAGGALGLAIAGGYGFDPAAQTHTETAIAGVRLAIAWLPAGIVVCGALLFARLPLNARRHAIIQRRLQARDRQAAETPSHTRKPHPLKTQPLPQEALAP